MLIRNKTYISLLFAGSNWAGIILRPVGGDPRVMLVMSCKKKNWDHQLLISMLHCKECRKRCNRRNCTSEQHGQPWKTIKSSFIVRYPHLFFSRLQGTGAGEPSIACIGMPTSSSAKKCGRPAPRPDGGQRKQQRYRMVHK